MEYLFDLFEINLNKPSSYVKIFFVAFIMGFVANMIGDLFKLF